MADSGLGQGKYKYLVNMWFLGQQANKTKMLKD
jgi:hypothetical protein